MLFSGGAAHLRFLALSIKPPAQRLFHPPTPATPIGADIPWATYEAEAMKTNGIILGPQYTAHLLETESSGQKCVKLADAGGFVEFSAAAEANAMVVRFSLPDSEVMAEAWRPPPVST